MRNGSEEGEGRGGSEGMGGEGRECAMGAKGGKECLYVGNCVHTSRSLHMDLYLVKFLSGHIELSIGFET